jgi:chitin synthase
MFHPYEFYCLPFCLIYYMTVPSMYLLLVIYSLFNLWNVSWGTREVAQKKTKAEMEAEKKETEAVAKSGQKEGMMANLLDQFHLGGKGGEKGGLEFNLANLFKCMCFTHDDPLDPKKQLVSIAASLDKVNHRLSNIESGHDMALMGRRSSLGNRRRMTSVMETPEEEEMDMEDASSEGSVNIPVAVEEKIKRDPEKNPFWLDDFYPDNAELGGGPVDYLPGTEIIFWRELIKKYLQPLEMSKKDKADQLVGLKGYRDQLIFTFTMANLIWVLGISMMQTNKDMMSIKWPLDPKYNISYNSEAEQGPQIDMITNALILEPIGLFFMVVFLGILTLQLIGMLMHRWTNGKVLFIL